MEDLEKSENLTTFGAFNASARSDLVFEAPDCCRELKYTKKPDVEHNDGNVIAAGLGEAWLPLLT